MTGIKIICIFLIITTAGVQAQQYQRGLNAGISKYNEALRHKNNGKCYEAVPQFWAALNDFRLTRMSRDLPADHPLNTWEDKCINGLIDCGVIDLDRDTYFYRSPQSLIFDEKGGKNYIEVSTNATVWKVNKCPSWCTANQSKDRLTVMCQENAETTDREDVIVITANKLTAEVKIRQEARKMADFEKIKITDVQFFGKYDDNSIVTDLYDDMASLRPRITIDNLSNDNKIIKMDFKIFDPEGTLLQGSDSGYTWSAKIVLDENFQSGDAIEIPEWVNSSGTAFATPGKYQFEIWGSGVQLFSTPFEVVQRLVLEVLPQYLAFHKEGGEKSVTVTTNVSEWSVVKCPSWCTIRQNDKILSVTCDENIGTTGRNDVITIAAGAQQVEIPIDQAGKMIPEDRFKVSAGVKAGLNLANISNDESDIVFTPKMKPDFHAGIFADLLFNYRKIKFGIQPEALYSRQGFIFDGNAVNFQYITVPLMAKLYLRDFNIEIGPWISYLFSISPSSTQLDEYNVALSDLKGGKDVGVAVGVGYDFDLDFIVLTIGARYHYGLSDMANNLQWKNRVIAISLGVKF